MGCRGTASCQPGQTDHGERGKRSARAGLLVAARQGPMPADGRGAWRSPRSSPSPGKPGTWRRRTAGRQQQKPFGRSGVNSPAPLDAKSASERVLGWQTRLHRWPRHNRPPHVLWRAGCSGMGKSGSAGGSRKRTGGRRQPHSDCRHDLDSSSRWARAAKVTAARLAWMRGCPWRSPHLAGAADADGRPKISARNINRGQHASLSTDETRTPSASSTVGLAVSTTAQLAHARPSRRSGRASESADSGTLAFAAPAIIVGTLTSRMPADAAPLK